MKKSTLLIIFLLLFFTVTPNVYAAEPVNPVGPTPTSTNLTPDGEDASTISTFDGSYRLAIESVQAQVGSDTNIHNIYLTIRQNMASFVNRVAFQAVGTLGMYPGKTKAEILEQNLADSEQKGIALMAYDSAYSLLQSSPSQNIAGYYAGMLLPAGFVGNQSSVYADNCTPYIPGATPTPLPTGDWGALTQPPSCEGTTTYWNILSLSNLWSVSFTIAMSFVVMVLIYAGFMMMFRKKASGQGLVTISMALQNVVVGSVLALMSFALGAFFLNLSKFLTLIIADMFNQLMWSEFDPTVLTKWLGFKNETANTYISSPLSIFTKFVLVSLYGDYLAGSAVNLGALQGILPITSQALSGDVGGAGASAKMWFWDNLPTAQFWLKSPLYLIGRIIAAGLLFWYSIRIWWETVKTFLFMVGDTLLAPITFVMGSIPGMWKGQGVTFWFKRMLKNSLKAPAMFALVNVAGYVTISLALKSSTADPLAMISGGYYGSSGGMMNVGGMVNDVMGFVASGVGPNFIAMLAILSFVPRVPAFLDDLMDDSGSVNQTVKGTLKSFDKMVFNEAQQFDSRGKEAHKAGDKAYKDARTAGANPVTAWVKGTGTTLKGNNDAIGKTFRSNFGKDPTNG